VLVSGSYEISGQEAWLRLRLWKIPEGKVLVGKISKAILISAEENPKVNKVLPDTVDCSMYGTTNPQDFPELS
jgi:hypothetical protein